LYLKGEVIKATLSRSVKAIRYQDVQKETDDDPNIALVEQNEDIARATLEIQKFIEGLPDGEKELLFRIYWCDESQASIAREHGVSRQAVNKELNALLKKAGYALADVNPWRLDN
jgi:DNA-directed RNA polymerase specialized sigma24 family protein